MIQFVSLDWEFPSELNFLSCRAKKTLDELNTSCEIIACRMPDLKELRFHCWWICYPWEIPLWYMGIKMYRDIHRSIHEIDLPQLRVKHFVCSWGMGATGQAWGWKDILGGKMNPELLVSCWYNIGTVGYDVEMTCERNEETYRDAEVDVVEAWATLRCGNRGIIRRVCGCRKVEKLGLDVVNPIMKGS
jgi:hypothetical protein